MEQIIIIRGNFTIEGLPFKNVAQPLRYLKFKVNYPPYIQIDSFSSIRDKNKVNTSKYRKKY